METQKSQPEKQQSPASLDPAVASCRRKKRDDATFLEDVKDHIDEFIHASMEEHKSCFTKTMKKMFEFQRLLPIGVLMLRKLKVLCLSEL